MKSIAIIFSGLFLTGISYAQQATVSAGGVATGSGGTVSYSIGQVACASAASSSGYINQGVQQPHEVLITAIKENNSIQVSALPNPVSDNLQVVLAKEPVTGMYCQLFDLSGKMLMNRNILSRTMQIDMSAYAPAVYTLRVCDESGVTGTFKVIKK